MQRVDWRWRFRRTKSGSTYMVIDDVTALSLCLDVKFANAFRERMRILFGFRSITGPFNSRHYGDNRLYFK